MLDVFPEGFEESPAAELVELAGYVATSGAEERCAMLDGAISTEVAEGWETAWQEYHQPVVIEDLWLGQPWKAPPAGLTAVTIRPGMAFGTGAHATTRLCIELLLAERPGALVDLGCGSGVLAVVGGTFGFSPVVAVDVDAVAVAETRAHARLNGVEIDVRLGDAAGLDLVEPPLVIANLPQTELGRSLAALRPKRAIVSGFRAGDVAAMPGYRITERRLRDGWQAARIDRAGIAEASGVYP